MTLRLRLVLALVVLLTVGLALFGFATYSLYAHSQYQRLDDQISSSVNAVTVQLLSNGTTSCTDQSQVDRHHDHHRLDREHRPALGSSAAPGQYFPVGAERRPRPAPGEPPARHLRRAARPATAPSRPASRSSTPPPSPTCPTTLHTAPGTKRFFTTGSVEGSGQWRVLVTGATGTDGDHTVVVAVPLGDVDLVARPAHPHRGGRRARLCWRPLSVGSWLILRRGLHPLEQMSTTAGAITAGDLTQRVSPSGGPTEVGQLGLALNTMLDDIEEAFLERDVTEQRLRQFLADASHELRTPITSIQGFAELFRVGADHAQVDLPTILRRIEEESARMRVLVEDLLLLAQLDQTRETQAEPVDLAVLAADACSDAVAGDRDRPVTLDAPEPVVVRGDEAHLRQAIANLVVQRAAPHAGRLRRCEVRARRDGDGPRWRCATTVRGSTPRRSPTCSTGSGRPTGPGPARAPGWAWPSWPASPPSTAARPRPPTPPTAAPCFTLRLAALLTRPIGTSARHHLR